jgi:hypothetical protein
LKHNFRAKIFGEFLSESNIEVFFDVTLCNLVDGYQCFEEIAAFIFRVASIWRQQISPELRFLSLKQHGPILVSWKTVL